jgi:cytochrome c5
MSEESFDDVYALNVKAPYFLVAELAPFHGAVTVAIGAAAFVLGAAAELTELPQGPDRDLVSKVCQSCHDLQMVFDAAGISRQEWDMSLDEMTANGMNISPNEPARILAYLSTYTNPQNE